MLILTIEGYTQSGIRFGRWPPLRAVACSHGHDMQTHSTHASTLPPPCDVFLLHIWWCCCCFLLHLTTTTATSNINNSPVWGLAAAAAAAEEGDFSDEDSELGSEEEEEANSYDQVREHEIYTANLYIHVHVYCTVSRRRIRTVSRRRTCFEY